MARPVPSDDARSQQDNLLRKIEGQYARLDAGLEQLEDAMEAAGWLEAEVPDSTPLDGELQPAQKPKGHKRVRKPR